MEIQSDLIILPESKHLPLPWSVRGPLGLETGSAVSIALVHGGGELKLPDIIVSPLQSEYLSKTYTLDVELGERSGAVADYLSWLGDSIAKETGNTVNIALSETITLEGRNKHKMHLVLEPASDKSLELKKMRAIVEKLRESHCDDVLSNQVDPVYKSAQLNFLLQQQVQVHNGWLKYNGWITRILEKYPEAHTQYDLTRVVVSSNPEQRLLRFIIPRKGVIELRVPHQNKPGALRAISNVIRQQGYNILSSRLSRTPPSGLAPSISVFVAACEPLKGEGNKEGLKDALRNTDTKFGIDNPITSTGKAARYSLYLKPPRHEMVLLDSGMLDDRDDVRADVAKDFQRRHQSKKPRAYIFLSRRFINRNKHKDAFEEQNRTLRQVVDAIESLDCAAVEAADPGFNDNRYYDDYVFRAVFARLWASDACLVLALDENQKGHLSVSMAHEIGFFAGRNKPLKVLVSSSREQDPVFGNIVGKNRITYPDGDAAFVLDDSRALFSCVRTWLKGVIDNR